MIEWLLIDALICGAVGAMITSARGAGWLLGALVGGFFGPLGVIASFAFNGEKPAQRIAEPAENLAQFRDCPFCAEPIRLAAIKCRYCGSDVKQVEVQNLEGCVSKIQNDVPIDKIEENSYTPDAKAGDRIILMLVLAIGILLAFLFALGSSF